MTLVIELSNIGTSYNYESDVHQLSTPLRPVSIVFNDRNLIQMVSGNYWNKSLIVRISDKSEHVNYLLATRDVAMRQISCFYFYCFSFHIFTYIPKSQLFTIF